MIMPQKKSEEGEDCKDLGEKIRQKWRDSHSRLGATDIFMQRTELNSKMMATYDTATVCLTSGQHDQQHQQQRQLNNKDPDDCLLLEPDLVNKMAESRDPEALREVWEGWREVAGKPQRQRYQQFVHLLNEGAKDNGFTDFSQFWARGQFFDDTDLDQLQSELWSELRPLYLQLHAYVRGRLRQQYGGAVMGTDGTVPAHLLGNMWAETWDNIFSLVSPYPDLHQASDDVDKQLKSKYDVHGLFSLAESFYVSMGLYNMTNTFWDKSMLERPEDREVQCHPSAADFYSPGDFRIKMCTSVSEEYLRTIHHEMGHVQYFMAYAHQPTVYRAAPSLSFHEAIGDTATLSVMSKRHLAKLGLATSSDSSDQTKEDINALMKMALSTIAFLPYGILVDKWRWGVFRGETTPDNYNCAWWKLRLDLQGQRPPVPRSEDDFDPAAKLHVVTNTPYISYFFSNLLQFQFYKTLCQAGGHQGPLHRCDFGGSVQAGTLFKNFMALGSSRPWRDALESFTGSRNITAQPLLEYFEPLRRWLKQKNEENGEPLGWENASVDCLQV